MINYELFHQWIWKDNIIEKCIEQKEWYELARAWWLFENNKVGNELEFAKFKDILIEHNLHDHIERKVYRYENRGFFEDYE